MYLHFSSKLLSEFHQLICNTITKSFSSTFQLYRILSYYLSLVWDLLSVTGSSDGGATSVCGGNLSDSTAEGAPPTIDAYDTDAISLVSSAHHIYQCKKSLFVRDSICKCNC